MKQKLLLSAAAFLFNAFLLLHAQSIKLVPNPDKQDTSGHGLVYGYQQDPVVLNGKLVVVYKSAHYSALQLATYTGSGALHLIANPDTGSGYYRLGPPVILSNKLYFTYNTISHTNKLAYFNGSKTTLVPNPDASTIGFTGYQVVYNNTLYGTYRPAGKTATQYVVYNGSTLSLIANPDNSSHGFENTFNIVFNNTLCAGYVNSSGVEQLAVFNGSSWKLLNNPDNSTTGIRNTPIIYNNKLYVQYFTGKVPQQYELMEYDGVNNPTLIANPADLEISSFTADPIVYNNQLYYGYEDTTGTTLLAKFNGTNITLLPNPDNSSFGVKGIPAIYNNKLYYFYLDNNFISRLAEYQQGSGGLQLIPNPGSGGCFGTPLVYNNNLYFQYIISQVGSLAKFNGDSIAIITNPPGNYTGSFGSNGYLGYPIVFNGSLFLQFGSIPTIGVGNLCYLTQPTASIDDIIITRKATGNTEAAFNVKLYLPSSEQIKIAYETKNGTAISGKDYIAKSGTITFKPGELHKKISITIIGDTVTKVNKVFYVFLDHPKNVQLSAKDSASCTIKKSQTFADGFNVADAAAGTKFSVYPNPADKVVTIMLPLNTKASAIALFDMDGRKMLAKQVKPNCIISNG